MSELTKIVIEAGLVSEEALKEISRWCPVEVTAGVTPESISDIDVFAARLRTALEESDLVEIRDTDLDAVERYLAYQMAGKLRVRGKHYEVMFGITKFGEYLIPWQSDELASFMTDPDTTLKYSTTSSSGTIHRVSVEFSDVRELFFGNRKTFMVCTPVVRDTNGRS